MWFKEKPPKQQMEIRYNLSVGCVKKVEAVVS